MSADDAFASLMRRNALVIPIASPSPETKRENRRRTGLVAGEKGAQREEAIRVLDLLDETPRDYSPRGVQTDEEEGIFNKPTETDLDPVGEIDSLLDVSEARAHGARIIGRDAGADDLYTDDSEYESEYEDVVPVAEQPPLESDAGLERARTVRRFAYIPLRGMEDFENRARDIMALTQSQEPERPSLAITSSVRGEGQTEIAIRLALAMAKRVDYRVLLADFDLRHPQLAARLGLTSKYFTLVDVLRGSCLLGEALLYSEEENLYVLPARAADRDGDEFLDGAEVQVLMDQLHRTFDFSILGCGPMDHADAAIICRNAGFSALAGYCGFSRAGALREAAEKLTDVGARVAGMLLTGS